MIHFGWFYAFVFLSILVHLLISFWSRFWHLNRDLALYRELYRDEKKVNEQLVNLIDSIGDDEAEEGWSDDLDWEDSDN